MSWYPRRRIVPVAFALVALLVLSGVALAYWTATGAGTGTAAAAAGTTPLVVNQTTVVTNLYPGDSAQTISGNFDNPNAGPVYVTTVTASIASVTKGGVTAVGCDLSDFTLAPTTATVNAEVAAGSGKGSWSGPAIKFNDKGLVNQDGCKGVTVNFTYSIP